jgi:hypothetical protein
MSLHYKAWTMLFAIRKKPEELFCDMFHCIEDMHSQITCVAPPDLSSEQQLMKPPFSLCSTLSG